MTARLTGKVAVITGGASGIGLATARRFIAEDAQVVIGDIDQPALAVVARAFGQSSVTAGADVTSEADIAELVASATQRFGGLDVAVANAGGGHCSHLVDHDLAAGVGPATDFRRVGRQRR